MKRILLFSVLWFGLSTLTARSAESSNPGQLELKPGDHVVLIGNTLADRFQHSGWLETFIHAKYPNHDLVFRNLAVAGDEVRIRHRPENFGSAEDWLKKTKADVIFAFFGFNESFQGPEGLAQFRADLEKFITNTGDYSGKGRAKIVLFSPIASEPHPSCPNAASNNENLTLYAGVMREVAAAQGILFVDLFQPSRTLFTQGKARREHLTINGIHLTTNGDRLIAQEIFRALFGQNAPDTGRAAEKLRQAVNEKNAQWHARYRTVDGNNIYGGRSALAYQPGKGGFINDRQPETPYVSNFKVMQEEMSQRDVLTANRDKRVWAVAKGKDLVVDDSNLPEVTKLKSNLPGPNPDESFKFVGGEEAIAKMKVHSGMKVNLFASEERFPELAKPVQMAWDTKGRLWVAVWPNYPARTPQSKVGDSLLIFEDTNADGKADKCIHFIDNLNAPTGFQFYKDGVLLVQAPDVWFVRDTNGDDKADSVERLLMGMSSADSHHTANSLCLDPGGAVYLSDGVFHRTQVETAMGPVRNNDGAIYRYEPGTSKFETYVSYDFANPHGRVFDYWGNDLITDGTGNANYFGPAFSGRLDYPAKHRSLKQFWKRPSRPCAATTLLTSRHFPDEFQGNFLNCNVIGFQGIYRVKVTEEGSGLAGETQEDIVSSSDPHFRPVAVNIGADGAIYFADWQNPIIGHMQHHLRDPNRDHVHGRIYRISYNGRPLMKPERFEKRSIKELLDLLKEPENQTRELAKVELGKRPTAEVIATTKQWTTKLDQRDPAHEHHLLEALWVHQWHDVVDQDLLKRLLASKKAQARAAAGRVLCYWRDRVPDALNLFKMLAEDGHPRVRLEAVRAASFFQSVEAVDAALLILKHPSDHYLDYTLGETLRQLRPSWRKALESGAPIAEHNPQGRDFLLRTVPTGELQAMTRTQVVLEALLSRPDVLDADRMVALGELAQVRKREQLAVLLEELQKSLEALPKAADQESIANRGVASLARLLPYQHPDQLKSKRQTLGRLAANPASAEVRRGAWAALALADDGFDVAWREAGSSVASLMDLLEGIPLITDSAFRAKAYDKVKPLLAPAVSQDGSNGNEALRPAAIRAITAMNHEPGAVFSALRELIARGQSVQVAAQGLAVLPRASWPRSEAGPAAEGLIKWAKAVPTSGRTAQDYCEIIQLAGDLAGLLPVEQATALQKELKMLRVSLFVIRAVREQMRYDTPRLVVEAGKPFEILFENPDFMPHNLVVIKPDSREKLGQAAATMKPDQLDREGRAYIPDMREILAATKMLQTGQRESLKLRAPSEEGDCEYVCTFPNHYQSMWGRLVVTKDVDAYLRDHPEAPVPPPAAAGSAGEEEHAHKHAH